MGFAYFVCLGLRSVFYDDFTLRNGGGVGMNIGETEYNIPVKDAAAYLKMHYKAFLKVINAKAVPYFQQSPKIKLFSKRDLDNYVRKNIVRAA